MSRTYLLHWAGVAAVVAGALRIVAAFLPGNGSGLGIELLYLVIDICILFGTMGFYALQYELSGRLGFGGFVVAIVGIGLIIGPDGAIAGVPIYPVGALLFASGLSLLALGSWRTRLMPRWVLGCWVASLLLGLFGVAIPNLGVLVVLSGVVFGVSFSWAGARLLSAA